MNELDNALLHALSGETKQKAVERFRGYLAEWGLVMPPAEILVEDFGLGDFWRVGLIECWIANETEAGYCGKFLFVLDGQSCPLHLHRSKHETFFIVRGKVQLSLEGTERLLQAGEVLSVPPGRLHSFRGCGAALLLEVSQPCIVADNFFADPRIPIGGNYRQA